MKSRLILPSYFYIFLLSVHIITSKQETNEINDQNETTFQSRLDERLFPHTEYLSLIVEAQKEECLTTPTEYKYPLEKKPITFMVYMAADNDLHYFAWKNLKQMELIGSNENCNIVVQLNTPGKQTPTKRYLIKKDKRVLQQHAQSPNTKLNSGNPETVIDFVNWAKTYYPAHEYALVFWDHGSGSLDPDRNFSKLINPCDLFYNNPCNNKLELDRGISYLSLLFGQEQQAPKRGICFDETYRSYINNHELEYALDEICNTVLGQKLAIVGFDACLMAMIEIANVAKKYAQYMVASQDIEYGTGWNYELVLKPLLQKSLTPKELAEQVVIAYEQAYQNYINDYTLSALNLLRCDEFEQNLNNIANLLTESLQESSAIRNIIRKCKSTQHCTCFEEPSYIDCGHFYKNLLQHLNYFTFANKQKEAIIRYNLKNELEQGLKILASFVSKNTTGQKLKGAHGVSIYFPEYAISQTYLKTPFCLSGSWGELLSYYIFG